MLYSILRKNKVGCIHVAFNQPQTDAISTKIKLLRWSSPPKIPDLNIIRAIYVNAESVAKSTLSAFSYILRQRIYSIKRNAVITMNELLSKEGIAYIVERIIDNAKDSFSENDSDFNKGKRLAYYEILDTIKNELIVRDADLNELGLDFNLEELL